MLNVRGTMDGFPGFLQPVITWVTGKPGSADYASIHLGMWGGIWVEFVLFLVGAFISMFALTGEGWAVIPSWVIGGMLIVHASRTIQVVYLHHLAHESNQANAGSHSELFKELAAELMTIILFLPSFLSYREDHLLHHHLGKSSEGRFDEVPHDPDLRFLKDLGFNLGMERSELWRKLIYTMVSPNFHWLFFVKRLRGNIFAVSTARKIAFVLYWGALFWALFTFDFVMPFILGWGVPVIIFYQVSALLQFCCEHSWSYMGDEDSARKYTFGRFCGECAPEQGDGVLSWAAWLLKMVFYHLPSRYLVLVGDLPQHDWHHIVPNTSSRRWMNAIVERENYSKNLEIKNGVGLTETWGLFESIDRVFIEMADHKVKGRVVNGAL